MAEKIPKWADRVWNPIDWADMKSGRKLKFYPKRLKEPENTNKAYYYIVCGSSDLFHKKATIKQLDKIFDIIYKTPCHHFFIQTEHPHRSYDWYLKSLNERAGMQINDFMDNFTILVYDSTPSPLKLDRSRYLNDRYFEEKSKAKIVIKNEYDRLIGYKDDRNFDLSTEVMKLYKWDFIKASLREATPDCVPNDRVGARIYISGILRNSAVKWSGNPYNNRSLFTLLNKSKMPVLNFKESDE